MLIQIMGTGCTKCEQLQKNTELAVEELKINADVVKISDMDEIMNMGVVITPALAINGDIKSTGKLLSTAEIKKLLNDES